MSLSSVPITAEELKAWQSCLPTFQYPAGQVLFYSGHLPYGVFIFAKGIVELTNARGRRKLGEIQDLAIVGLSELLHNAPYAGTAKVVQQTSALFAEKTRFFEMVYKNQSLLPRTIGFAELNLIGRHFNETLIK